MKELLVDGETGFLVEDIEGAMAAVDNISFINRYNCRRHAMAHFSRGVMTSNYIEVYKTILGDASQD